MSKYIILGTLKDEFIPTFFSCVQKHPANLKGADACVTLTETGIALHYDIKYFAEATREQIDMTLSHELVHVLNMHFIRSFDLMDEFNLGKGEFFKKLAPLADLPTNQSVSSLPAYQKEKEHLLTYDKIGIAPSSFPTYESVVRWAMTKKGSEDLAKHGLGPNGSGNGMKIVFVNGNGEAEVLSDGGGNGDGPVIVVPEMTKEGESAHMQDIADIVRNSSRTAGNAPHDLRRLIEQFLDEMDNRVLKGWDLIEHYLVGERAINRGGDRTYGRLNRRTKMLPGRKRIMGFSAAFVVDESGSMSDEEVQIAFALTKKVVLRENRDKVYIVHWDTEPHPDIDEIQFEHEMDKVERKKGGGTNFSEFFSHPINQRIDADVIVCVTDGYPYPWPESEATKPVIWIITQKGGYDAWERDYGKGMAVCVDFS